MILMSDALWTSERSDYTDIAESRRDSASGFDLSYIYVLRNSALLEGNDRLYIGYILASLGYCRLHSDVLQMRYPSDSNVYAINCSTML